jgi:hypothetical protein
MTGAQNSLRSQVVCIPSVARDDVELNAWYASVVRAAFVYNLGDCSAIRGERRGGSCVLGCTMGSVVGAGVGAVLCTGVAVVLSGGMLVRVCRLWIRGMVRNASGAVGAVDVGGLYGVWL